MGKRIVTKETRFRIFARDNNKCRVCGRGAEDGVKLTVDHKLPLSKGGTDDLTNLWTLCYDCNQGKADLILKAPSKETETVGIPIPPEYALDQVVQILGEYQRASNVSTLSIQQILLIVQKTPPISFNPLYYPLPNNAIKTALDTLEKEKKVKIIDDMVDITKLSEIDTKIDRESLVIAERRRSDLIKEIYNPIHGYLIDALKIVKRNYFGRGERNNTLGDRRIQRIVLLQRNIFWHQLDPDLRRQLESLEDMFEQLRKVEEALNKKLPQIWRTQPIDPSAIDKFLELSAYILFDFDDLPQEVIERMEKMIRTSEYPYGRGTIIGMFFKQIWDEFRITLGKEEIYQDYHHRRKLWEETLFEVREIVIQQIK